METIIVITLTEAEARVVADALTYYANDQVIDDPHNYSAEELAAIALNQDLAGPLVDRIERVTDTTLARARRTA